MAAEQHHNTVSNNHLEVEQRSVKTVKFWKSLINWTTSSLTVLSAVEHKILSCLRLPFRTFNVQIGSAVGEDDKIWTIALNTESKEVPVVMLHGLGAGLALWVLNLDALAEQRPVYAMDILGFGRSTRPKFANDAVTCEQQFVASLEEWRKQMNLQQMILLGHSMGGFIAASYTLSHPEHIKHLILADPWGFPEWASTKKSFPLWVRAIAVVVTPFNPLFAIRVAGPMGKWLLQKIRPDIIRKFSAVVENAEQIMPQYLHQCNAQTPSGEAAFHEMLHFLGSAKYPMVHRIVAANESVPMTFIYGARSWIDRSTGEKIQQERTRSYVDIISIPETGHHVYADKPDVFNAHVNEICRLHAYVPIERMLTENMAESLERAETVDSALESQEEHEDKELVHKAPSQISCEKQRSDLPIDVRA